MTKPELDRLTLLTPETLWRVERVIQKMKDRGFDIYVGGTRRTKAEELAARASGHSGQNQTSSWHMLGRAADLRLRAAGGGASFDQSEASEPFWRALYEEATALGLRSLAYRPDGSKFIIQGARGPLWDSGHVEWRAPFGTLAEAMAAEGRG